MASSSSAPSPSLLISVAVPFLSCHFLAALPAVAAVERCHLDDKAALLEIKKAMGDPRLLLSWDPKTDCCNWQTVTCDPNTNRVSLLDISVGNATGFISPSIGKLQTLKQLTVRKLDKLTGPIPLPLCSLTGLNLLRLDWNQLTGSIPACLSNLKALTYLDLSFNRLTGLIPPSLGSLPKLEVLHLDRNMLTGSIPVSFGGFPGPVAPDLFLSHNNLTGEIPASLGAMDFARIDLSRNRLEGNASWLFGSWKRTQSLDISRNLYIMFDFSIVSFPCKTLVELRLDHNEIYGRIPNGILECSSLKSFNVSYNRLCGSIPQGPVMKQFDEYVFDHTNCLCGPPLQFPYDRC